MDRFFGYGRMADFAEILKVDANSRPASWSSRRADGANEKDWAGLARSGWSQRVFGHNWVKSTMKKSVWPCSVALALVMANVSQEQLGPTGGLAELFW